ncbi:phosphodiester glycosidase family protein [Aeoliella sp. ICT_H6.2]|uniref:Phosphodiester glycosidase family protein n=1 Tax=Aeoliella straminimaris TaxID=2954799 RepID=A0A9X2JG59_9BACT|nr:phosphodiester glycosidase family protein [Aeoliella straminimaris]MCO6043168.1 phosphodiester glycosidase family protein [Aeoliella straminimaris]
MARFSCFCLVLVTLLVGYTAGAEEHVARPFHGVTLRELTREEPRPLKIWIAEIDLAADGISFRVTPGNGDPNGEAPGDPNGETTRQTTLEFLQEQHAQLAINATFFGMRARNTDNTGLVVSDGQRVSPFRGDWPSINIDAQNQVAIVRGEHDTYRVTSPSSKLNLHNAITGSNQIVTDGSVTTDERKFSRALHPRTAIGYTADNRLILAVVDGRQPGVSEGMSLPELAQLMLENDCVQAVNLDGGGSTTMAIADPAARVLNTPCSKNGKGEFGTLRQNGTSLAVFARPATERETCK